MRIYDLILVIRSSLFEDKRKKLIDTIKEWLTDAKFGKEKLIGQKALAYKIKKEEDGYFVTLAVETGVSVPSDFEKKIQANEDVLRHLLIRRK